MGREVRRVPADWEHPQYPEGHRYKGPIPLLKYSLTEMAVEAEKYGEPAPDPNDFMETHVAGRECTAFQVYETVTEGTPTSPVFQSQTKMVEWLVNQGHSKAAAEKFAECGWAPSMAFVVGVGHAMGIDAHDLMSKDGAQ